MGKKPLVGCGHEFLFTVQNLELLRKIVVGSLRKNDDDAEAVVARLAGSIVQGRRINLDHDAGRYAECLAGRCVQLMLRRNIRLLCEDQNRILTDCNVELAAAVILKRVQHLVVAVAVSDLDRNKTVHRLLQLLRYRELFELGIARNIDRPSRTGRLHHAFQKLCQVIPRHDPAVFPEFRIIYTIDFHVCNPPAFELYISLFQHSNCITNTGIRTCTILR